MKAKFNEVALPLLSICFLILGAGFFMTFITVKMTADGASTSLIGVIHSCYYAGLFLGAFVSERIVRLIGHIRAFTAHASLTAITILVQGLADQGEVWALMRFICGFCMAVQYVVIESWLLSMGTIFSRGRILALYMIVFYVSQAFSQFFLDLVAIESAEGYIVSGIWVALSILPVCYYLQGSPAVPEPSPYTLKQVLRASPFGFTGCFVSGALLGTIYGLTPAFAIAYNLTVPGIMFATIMGGVLLQWPIGKLSDLLDRRYVLLALSLSLVIPSSLIILQSDHETAVLIYSFWLGGFAFTLYPLSIAEVCDHFEVHHVTVITSVLLIVYGVGAIFGPLTAPFLMLAIGASGLFVFYIISTVLLAIFGIIMMKRERHGVSKKFQEFVALPSVTPVAYELDPRNEKENMRPR